MGDLNGILPTSSSEISDIDWEVVSFMAVNHLHPPHSQHQEPD